jgi:predicted phosphodiesterase
VDNKIDPETRGLLQKALDLMTEYGTSYAVSKATGLPETTIGKRSSRAVKLGMKPSEGIEPRYGREVHVLERKVKALQSQLKQIQFEEMGAEEIKQKIFKIAKLEPTPPDWLVKPLEKNIRSAGIPTLFCSDWHWGEFVDNNEMGGIDNSFSLKIAHERARCLVESAIDLMFNHMVNPEYEGIVLALGGDMFAGDIHEELTESNESTMMQTMLDLLGVLVWVVNQLLEKFPNVFVVGVTGNHGRTTRKPRHKGRAYTNFDWLLYQLLKRHYHPYEGKADRRVSFLIPDGPDALFKIYDTRYCLTHGDQFRGGDGITGALMPIMRGDHKKRSRNSQINQEYDVLMMGHFHTLWQSRRLIVNGSLKGYDEYAYNLNLPFEPPLQSLTFTHPDRGVTFSIPIHVQPKRKKTKSSWVSVPK